MVTDKKLKTLIVIMKIRMRIARGNGNEEIAGIYAGVVNELNKLKEEE